MKLIAKIIISGKIKTETGLHIGGSSSALDIGGVDLNVIKTPKGVPYIPGSSLKGKLRTLLARTAGSMAVSEKDLDKKRQEKRKEQLKDTGTTSIVIDVDIPYLINIFGSSGDDEERGSVTRLLVRDAFLNEDDFKFNKEDLDFDYTDVKWENTIDRIKGTALHPRQLERVPAGTYFDFEMVYDVYDDGKMESEEHLKRIKTAMKLLESDYIGGSGSRGYGKIKIYRCKFQTQRYSGKHL